MILLFFAIFSLASAATVDVPISTGPVNATVRGNVMTDGWIFLGIPYSQPPIGDLRFEVGLRKIYGTTNLASSFS